MYTKTEKIKNLRLKKGLNLFRRSSQLVYSFLISTFVRLNCTNIIHNNICALCTKLIGYSMKSSLVIAVTSLVSHEPAYHCKAIKFFHLLYLY